MQPLTRLLPLLLLVALAAPARGGLLPCLDPYYPWSIRVGPYLNVVDPGEYRLPIRGNGWYDQYGYGMEKSFTCQEVHIGDTLTINLHDTNVSIINGDHGTAYWSVDKTIDHDCWGDGGLVLSTGESFNALYEVNYAKWLSVDEPFCPTWCHGDGYCDDHRCTPAGDYEPPRNQPHRFEPVSEPSSVMLVLVVIIVAAIVIVKKRK